MSFAFQDIFANSPNPYMVLDREFRYLEVNRAYEEVAGRPRQELIGHGLFEMFPGDENEDGSSQADVLRASLERVLATGERDVLALIPYSIPSEAAGEAPELRYWSATHTPLKDGDGRVTAILQHTTDVTELERLREQLNAARGEKPKLTMLPLLISAICKTLPDFPMINARFDDEAGVITRHGAVHLGMATQTDGGLMVPVIRDAQAKNLWQLATEIRRLADAARDGSAKSNELSGSTLTVTSLGPLGGVATTPVINRPEVAIIGPNRIVERPMFVSDGMGGERIEKRKLMNISISCDHRVVDGWDAASFVQAVKKLIESPALLLVH